MGFFSSKKSKDARRKKLEEFNAKHFGSKIGVPSATKGASLVEEVQQVVDDRSPTPVLLAKSKSAEEQRTMADKVNSFADNIVNPENHPEEQPVTKQSSDEPTEDDEDESQDDMDRDEKDETLDASAATSGMVSPTTLLDQVKSEESKIVETISPPNMIKPMDKEDMEKFIEEQKAQQNTGLLCGCI